MQAQIEELLVERRFDPTIAPQLEAYVDEQVPPLPLDNMRPRNFTFRGALATRTPSSVSRCAGTVAAECDTQRATDPLCHLGIAGSMLRQWPGVIMQVKQGKPDVDSNLALLRFYQYQSATAKPAVVAKVGPSHSGGMFSPIACATIVRLVAFTTVGKSGCLRPGSVHGKRCAQIREARGGLTHCSARALTPPSLRWRRHA
jgi:hypothetical protein